MRNQLLEILEDIRPDVDFENEKHLITDQILESFDIVSLVAELTSEFDIDITTKDLIAENFNSVEALLNMIQELQEA